MSHFNDKNLDFWIEKSKNVLFRGKHGVGKTARVLESFKRHDLKFVYFSASSLDPFVDFCGIPTPKTDNGSTKLDFALPQWQLDGVEAIFLDEYNRAPKKVRNAVMELIQFKSINGRQLKNLKIVWAAINPEEEEGEVSRYDVDMLDPAQLDRFHVVVNVPYQPEASYFRQKYGREQADIALSWWKDILKDKEKDLVSPRRLDYMLETFNQGGEIKPMVHSSINLQPLTQQLKNGSIEGQLKNIFDAKDAVAAKNWFRNENNFHNSINCVIESKELVEFFVPNMSNEKITVLMAQHNVIKEFVLNNYAQFKDLIHQIAGTKSSSLSAEASSVVVKNMDTTTVLKKNKIRTNTPESTFVNKLQAIKSADMNNTGSRVMAYRVLEEHMPTDMSIATATNTLKILESCLCRSRCETTAQIMPELPKLIGHVVCIFDEAGQDWAGVVDQKNIMLKLSELSVYTISSASAK